MDVGNHIDQVVRAIDSLDDTCAVCGSLLSSCALIFVMCALHPHRGLSHEHEAFLQAQLARPLTHRVATVYACGKIRTHDTRSEGALAAASNLIDRANGPIDDLPRRRPARRRERD